MTKLCRTAGTTILGKIGTGSFCTSHNSNGVSDSKLCPATQSNFFSHCFIGKPAASYQARLQPCMAFKHLVLQSRYLFRYPAFGTFAAINRYGTKSAVHSQLRIRQNQPFPWRSRPLSRHNTCQQGCNQLKLTKWKHSM